MGSRESLHTTKRDLCHLDQRFFLVNSVRSFPTIPEAECHKVPGHNASCSENTSVTFPLPRGEDQINGQRKLDQLSSLE